jgi:HSP20 family molecular chaperone IbpA
MFKKILMLSALFSTPAFSENTDTDKKEEPNLSNKDTKNQSSTKNIFTLMEELTNQMRNAFDDEFQKFNSKFKAPESISPKVEISEGDTHVIIKMQVPVIAEKGITIDAKKNRLKGQLNTDDGGYIRFVILDGKSISVSYSLKKQQETKNDNNAAVKIFSSSCNNYFTLPAKVTKLEDAKVELKENILTLNLPKSESNWKKIEVK